MVDCPNQAGVFNGNIIIVKPIKQGELDRFYRQNNNVTVILRGMREVVVVLSDSPQGHKVALRNIKDQENIIKYGYPIGDAICDLIKGKHIHVRNIKTNLLETQSYSYRPIFKCVGGVDSETFMGYR